MARSERTNREEQGELEEENHHKKRACQLVHDRLEALGEGAVESLVKPSVDKHTTLLADVRSDEQRASLVTQLQQSYGNAYVQRIMERIQGEKSSGQPLEPETRSEMEAAFGQDFSDVHIHTDATADKLAKELGAQAFTAGEEIFFREAGR